MVPSRPTRRDYLFLCEKYLEMTIKKNESLLPYNAFGFDVKADYFVEYTSKEELIAFLQSDLANTNPILQIGAGSNLLFLADFQGVVLHSAVKYTKIVNEDENHIYINVGSGVIWDDLVAFCVEKGWGGIENLSLIPGEVGASAVQNIGAYGVEAQDRIFEVKAVNIGTQEETVFSLQECKYGYRDSVFKNELAGKYIIISVTYKLDKQPRFCLNYQHLEEKVREKGETNLKNIRETIIEMRTGKLPEPEKLGNAGSFFMNPVVSLSHFENLKKDYPAIPHYIVSETEVKIPAGWLIEQCGWKGKKVGNVGVHKNQALVLVHFGNGKGNEIVQLAEDIQNSVKEKFEIQLYPEVNYIG